MEIRVVRSEATELPNLSAAGTGLSAGFKTVRMADLDFSAAKTVQGIGFRFLIPVPALGEENKTLTVKNWKGQEETVVGYSFKNATDGADQAVVGDGSGVTVVGLNPEQTAITVAAKSILDKIDGLGGAESLNVTKLNELIKHIHESLGLKDTYNSTDKVAANMVAQAGFVADSARPLGLYEKAEKPGPLAVYVSGACEVLDGPHVGTAKYVDGFMAVQIPPKKEGSEPTYRSIAPTAINYCYVLEDGSRISNPEAQLPVV